MSTIRGAAALILFSAFSLASGPLGCLPIPPVEAKLPEAPGAEMPQAPEMPEFQPPAIEPPQAPDAPEVPLAPGLGGGNCCVRTGPQLKLKCGGAASCCPSEFESSGDCEDVKGIWFFSPEGCAGAC